MANDYLIVDGYNIIFAWEELRELAKVNLEAARAKLADILCNYQGFVKEGVILVFDGHKTKGNLGSVIAYHNIDIVYTKEAQSADTFIEAVVQQRGRHNRIRVATSDYAEQIVILGQGASRISARELQIEIEEIEKQIRKEYTEKLVTKRNSLLDNISPEMAKILEQMRLKKD